MDPTTITNYMRKYASSSVLKKGESIFRRKNFSIVNFDIEHDIFSYHVRSDEGIKIYEVAISVTKGRVTCTCTCPYSEGDNLPCKHGIAALTDIRQKYFLRFNEFKDEEYEQQNTTINIQEGISDEALRRLVNNNNHKKAKGFSLIGHQAVGEFIEIEKRIECTVKDGKHHFNLSFDRPNDNDLNTYCDCSEKDTPICSHKFAALYKKTVMQREPYFFDRLLNMDDQKNDLLAEYGYTIQDDIKNKFSFSPEHGRLILHLLDSSLQKISTRNNWDDKLFHLKNREAHLHLETEEEEIQDPDSVIAFAFYVNFYEFNFQIIPLVGKYGKNATSGLKNIRSLSEISADDKPLLDDTTNHLIKMIGKISPETLRKVTKKRFKDFSPKNPAHFFFMLDYAHEKMSLINKELPSYPLFLTDAFYGIRKSSLVEVILNQEKLDMHFTLSEKKEFLVLSATFFIKGESEDSCLVINRKASRSKADKTISRQKRGIQNNFEGYNYSATGQDYLVNDFFYISKGKMYPHGSAEHALKLKYFLNNPIIKVHNNDAEGFVEEVVLPLSKKYKIEFKTTMKPIEKEASGPVARVYLKELDNFMLIQPAVKYDQKEVELLEDEMILIRENKKMTSYIRHKDTEQKLKSLFFSLHPEFKNQEHRKMFYVRFSEVLKDGWFFDFFEKLKENNIEILGSEKITRINYSQHKPMVSISTGSGTDWFDLSITISYGSHKVRLKDVQKSFLKGEQFIELSDGKLGLLPLEWLKKFEDAMRMGEIRDDNIKISKLHFSLVDSLYEALEETSILKEINDRKKKLLSFSEISEVPHPSPVGTTLRDYQVASFHWMNFLNEYGWGGCLADDMGLGKTLQMLTFLKHQTHIRPDQPNLVVMPTTLIFNWIRETERFYPDLTFLVLHGSDRIKDVENFSKFNLIFITYSTLIRDIEFLKDYAFNYTVLDESQAIKNPNSQRYKAARLIKASHRLAMTGTPIENNTFDLYAQMSFVNPGLLGNMEFFKKEFSDPIDRKGDAYKAEKLRKMIKPFMLHRTKEQVARELPDKTETVLYCEMEEEQKKVYNAFRDKFRDTLLNKIDEQGLGKTGMLVLEALLKLRQICNSPALLNTSEDYGHDSVKLRELMRHIQEKTGKHKILVFSQFVKMLKLVQNELKENNISFEYLDGAVKNREERVQRFREDENCRVFLISLKAGGTGINLTEADYVYLIDPWWNPAVEAQAIDRTHRIGQTKKVFAYRMICKDTIEEKVLKLQEKKKAIAGELISTEQSFIKQLDKEDIKDLFS